MANKFKNLTEATLVLSTPGKIEGIIINSHTSGTIQVINGNTDTATNTITGVITLGATERYIPLFGANFDVALCVGMGGTINYTVVYS